MSEDIWNENVSNLSKARARLVKDLRVLIITVKTFSAQKIGFQAVALSFFCTMAAVPFIAIAIAITGGIGLDGTLKQVISTYITNPQAVDTLFGFVDNIINTAKSSTLGLLSALLFCWLVIWMMMCAESVFNNVWKVNKSRKIMKRISFYLLILILAPFIVRCLSCSIFIPPGHSRIEQHCLFRRHQVLPGLDDFRGRISPDILGNVQVHPELPRCIQKCHQGRRILRTGIHAHTVSVS